MNLSSLPPQVQSVLDKLLETHSYALPGGFSFSPNLLQAILMVILIFLLIFTLGHLRHTYVDWSVKGIAPGFTFGFAVAIILEGLFLIGGKTLFTELIGWKTAPKPISNVLDGSRQKIIDVLGVQTQIPNSDAASAPSSRTVVLEYKNLDSKEQQTVKAAICEPQ